MWLALLIIYLPLILQRKSGRKKNSGTSSLTSELLPLNIVLAVAGNEMNCRSATSNLENIVTQ